MIRESISPKETVDFLNSLLEIDRTVISDIFLDRKICNQEIADHPTVQVGLLDAQHEIYQVGMLGILNGLFGIRDDGYGIITMEVDSINDVIERFVLTEEVRDK